MRYNPTIYPQTTRNTHTLKENAMPSYHYLIATDEVTLTEQGNGDLLLVKGTTSVTIPAALIDTSDSTPGYVAADPGATPDSTLGKVWKRFWKWWYS